MTLDESYGAEGRGSRVLLWTLLGIALAAVLAVVGLHLWGAARLDALEREAREAAGAPPPAEPVPDEENAAARLLSGAELATVEPHLVFRRLRLRSAAEWTDDDLQAAREILLANAAALARMRGAADLPQGSFASLPGDWQESPLSPELLPLLERGGEVLRLHAWLALVQGDPELAAGSIRALLRLAESLYGVASPSAVVVGAHAELEALRTLQGLIAVSASPELLGPVEAALPRSDPRQAYRRGVARLVEAVRDGEGRFARGAGSGGLVSFATRELRRARALRGTVAAATAPDGRPLPEILDELAADAGGLPQAREEASALVAVRTALAARQLARLALALDAEAAEAGRYPRDAPEAPADPVTGGPFAYQLRSDGSVRLAYPQSAGWDPGAPRGTSILVWTLPPPAAAGAAASEEPRSEEPSTEKPATGKPADG